MQRWCVLLLLSGLSAWPLSVLARAKTVWDGVYTADQAKRGETPYRQNCALCHGAAMAGTENAPGLVGEEFLKLWYGKPVSELFKQVQTKMPKDAPGILKPQQTADILAYTFSVNKFPPGTEELAAVTEPLADIKIEKQPK